MWLWLFQYLCLQLAVFGQDFRPPSFSLEPGMKVISSGIKFYNQRVFSERTNRQQCVIFEGQQNMFPCKYGREKSLQPTSVHQLKPSDIDLVAALGDSISSGVGALATNLLGLFNEYRGVTFSAGGRGNWQQYLTLPNILKNFNPDLKGMALENTRAYANQIDGLNLAQAGSKTFNLSMQAYRLIDELKHRPDVDFYQDWKMVTIIIGHNDLCSVVCNRPDFQALTETSHVAEALDILYHHLPRAFVNLMPITDVSLLFDLKNLPLFCHFIRKWLCPCLFSPLQSGRFDKEKTQAWLDKYAEGLDRLVASGRYDTKDDFTVVIQPTLIQGSLPQLRNGNIDLNFLAPDCFHFSQRTHALVARGLWNNLLQPVGQKSLDYEIGVPFLCPSRKRPYFATYKNSLSSSSRTELFSNMEEFVSLMGTLPASSSQCPI